MTNFSDPKYLREKQYKTPNNLNARVTLHQRFSTNSHPWHRWVFDQLAVLPAAKIIDIGCGPAHLWAENSERMPEGCFVHLVDLSTGMLAAARKSLEGRDFSYTEGNLQDIPLEDEQFDMAVANHMLYHVPDIHRSLKEIRRTLKPGGKFFASTNGFRNLIEIWEWVAEALPFRTDILNSREVVLRFGLDNGEELLSQYFSSVTLARYPDSLEITEVQPIVDFVASTPMQTDLSQNELAMVEDFLARKLKAEKVLKVTKDMGIFVAE